MNEPTAKPKSSWINLVVDYGPLLVFFLAYRWFSPKDADTFGAVVALTKSTIAFMVGTLLALVISKWRIGKISPMLWLSSVLVIGFGALTVYTGNPLWIQHKPTVVYLIFSIALIVGWMRGKAILRYFLETAFDGLNEKGWLLVSRNWGFFFLFLAILNEAILLYLHHKFPAWKPSDRFDPITPEWLWAKLFIVTPLSFLFTFAQIPMLLRHGLGEEATAEVEQNPPNG